MSSSNPIDVRDMAIVHKTFRRAYEEGAALVRANPTPSAARVTFLADHVDFGLMMLHHHHEGEDELLYPLLVARVPDHAARTEQIDEEHKAVKVALDAAQRACAAWRASPSAESGEALAASLDEVNRVLIPHLDQEEREVVPLAAVTVTQAEWNQMGKHAVATMPANKRMVAFGMLLDPLSPADQAYMLSNVPPPVRVLYRLVGKHSWTKYKTTLLTGT